MKTPIHILSLLTLLGFVSAASAQTVTRGPYLQMGTPNSVVVRWRTSTATDSRVYFGAAPGNLAFSAGDAVVTTEHEVLVNGLTPNTQYYYGIGSSAQLLAGNDAEHYFLTFPPAGTTVPTRIWVIGDAGTATADQFNVRNAYYQATGTRYTDLFLMLGDNAYQSGTDAEYQTAVFNVYQNILQKTVLFSTLGNHETGQATNFVDTYPYFSIFTLPKNAEAGGAASGTEHYYSFDFGNIHFVCLDSMTGSRATNGAMANWLRSDLSSTTRDWIIAFYHHPSYSKGSHNSDTEIELMEMRQNFGPILENYGVDLVLSGHSHCYERSYLLDRHYGLSTTLSYTNVKDGSSGVEPFPYQKTPNPSSHNGSIYVVNGSSGQISGGSLNHPAMYRSLNVLGSVVIEVYPTNRLDLTFLNTNAAAADTFSIVKGATRISAAPTGVSAAAGNASVSLTWRGSSGAGSYNVKRAIFSGGPYAFLGGSSSQNYVDSTAVNGTTYYYVVSTVNAAGEGPDSVQVSARPQAPVAPVAPTNLKATGSKKKVSLTWTQSNSANVTQNKIYRATTSGGPYSLVATITAGTSYSNTGLTSGTTYYYVVTAVNNAGLESPASNEASATAK